MPCIVFLNDSNKEQEKSNKFYKTNNYKRDNKAQRMHDRTEWKPMKNQENDRGALWKVTLVLPQNRTLNRFDFFVSFLSAAFSVFFYSVYFCFILSFFYSSQSISSSLFIVNDFFVCFYLHSVYSVNCVLFERFSLVFRELPLCLPTTQKQHRYSLNETQNNKSQNKMWLNR